MRIDYKIITFIAFVFSCLLSCKMQAYRLIEEEEVPAHILNQRKLIIEQIKAELKSKYKIKIVQVICFLAPLGKEVMQESVNQLLNKFFAYLRDGLRNYLHGSYYLGS